MTPANPVTARKKWIAGSLEPRGALVIDAGAVKALRSGKSLLPAGVIKIEGAFGRGDAVVVRGPDGAEIGRGLIAYDADDADKIKGRSSADVLLILGFAGRTEMIHRDDLVLGRRLTPGFEHSTELILDFGNRFYLCALSSHDTRGSVFGSDFGKPLKAIDRSPVNPSPRRLGFPFLGFRIFRVLPRRPPRDDLANSARGPALASLPRIKPPRPGLALSFTPRSGHQLRLRRRPFHGAGDDDL